MGVTKSGNGIFGAVIPIGGDYKTRAGVGVGFDGKVIAFPSVGVSDEEVAVGDGGPEKWHHSVG